MDKKQQKEIRNMKKVYIVAELSANHNNDFQLAKDTITAMKEAGADAVKFQTYTADSLTLDVDNKYFKPRTEGLWKGRRLYELYKEAAMPYEWQPKLAEYAISLGLNWLSTPFDFEGVDFLESINIPAYKVASLEIMDIPLIEYIAKKQKPIILSTGIAKLADIELAVETCRNVGNNDITVLKCTSAYPTPFNEVNLNAIPTIQKAFNVKVGLSDHTIGHIVSLGAVAIGVTLVEKHFILDRKQGGVDSAFSMEPLEFKEMVDNIRVLEDALGKTGIEITKGMDDARKRGRSLFLVKDIKKGEEFTKENIKSIRPGYGLHPKYYWEILGKKATEDLKRGIPLQWQFIGD